MPLNTVEFVVRRPPMIPIHSDCFALFRHVAKSGRSADSLASIAMMDCGLTLALLLRAQSPSFKTGTRGIDLLDVVSHRSPAAIQNFIKAELMTGKIEASVAAPWMRRISLHSYFVGEMASEVANHVSLAVPHSKLRSLAALHEIGTMYSVMFDAKGFGEVTSFGQTSAVSFDIAVQCVANKTIQSVGAIAAAALQFDPCLQELLFGYDETRSETAAPHEEVLRICDWAASRVGMAWETWTHTSELPASLQATYERSRDVFDASAATAQERTVLAFRQLAERRTVAA